MIPNFRYALPLAVLALSLPAYAQTSVGTTTVQPAPIVTGPAQEGCAGDAAQFCPNTSGGGQAQCLQSNLPSVSQACQAAMDQTPAPGIAKHLGFDPPPTAAPAATPVNLPNFTPPQMPTSPAALPVVALPPPARVAPTIILAPPPNATNAGPAPVNPAN